MILTGGPSITEKEIAYVNDAIRNAWNKDAWKYIKKFEQTFADYIGVKYARTTTGGTAALWLSLAALGVGPGDEVIMPDVTYFACSDVTMLLGAKPVFVDILPDTWCIDPEKLERAITSHTKAIMPVHLYGYPCEMVDIMGIAQKYNLHVVEDACPAVGTLYKDKKAGSFGTFGCFSFHGAKIITTGFGGMVVSNDEKLFKRLLFLNDHGEDPDMPFWQTEVGYSFDISNMDCAMGLAQIERIEEIVEKHTTIFSWYEKYLDCVGYTISHPRPYTRRNGYRFSIVLDDDIPMTREQFMDYLQEKGVDTRPIFYPISMFPLYENQNNPIAYHVGTRGINLPTGFNRTEEEIKFICDTVKEGIRAC